MAAMSKRKMTRAKIADAYHQIESMRAQRPWMDLNKKSLTKTKQYHYLAHVIEKPNLRIPNPQYLQLSFCFDFFNDSENTFWGFFEI